MLQNYLTIALRNLLRNRTFSFINILGLAVGLACCLLIFLVVRFHTSFDTHQSKYTRVYAAVTENTYPQRVARNPGIPGPFAKAFREAFPQVEHVARVERLWSVLVHVLINGKTTDKKFNENQGIFAVEPGIFDVIDIPLLLGGNPRKAFAQPYQVLLSQKIATKYYGNWQEAIGKTLRLENTMTVVVAGVMADAPPNTDFPFEMLISHKTIEANDPTFIGTDWSSISSSSRVFFSLPIGGNIKAIEAQIPTFVKKHLPKQDPGRQTRFVFRPLCIGHYDELYPNLSYNTFRQSTMWALGLVGLLILVMACINFINLTTAQSVKRSKEVGIRKVMGGGRSELVAQFLGETFLVVVFSVLLALLLSEIALPYLHMVIDVPEKLTLLTDSWIWAFLVGLALLVTILAGLYPALILSGFEPVVALKSKISSQKVGGISLRRILVVVQFGIAQVLAIGTLVVLSQMDFIRTADLGMNPDAILLLNNPTTDSLHLQRFGALKRQLSQISGVKTVSFSSDVPSSDNNWNSNIAYDHINKDLDYAVFQKYADTDYFNTYNIEFVAGRAYAEADTAQGFIINETFMKALGVQNPEKILNKTLRMGGGNWKPIVGVIKDFKTNSLREEVKPMTILANKPVYYQIGLKLDPQNMDKTAQKVKAVWEKFYPEFVHEQRFYDEQIADYYRSEDQVSLLFRIFAGLALFISCLGLYGLVAFMAVQRTKEIGIRKVLGASIGQIVVMFSKEFVTMVLVAFLVAAPAGYYLMSEWLSGFVFKISLGVGVFALALVASLLVAMGTMGYRAYRAAIENPVRSLKAE